MTTPAGVLAHLLDSVSRSGQGDQLFLRAAAGVMGLSGDEAEILSLGVAMKWQRLGLGRRLIEGLIRAAQRAEARRLFLEVSIDNEAALKLYQSLDFRRVGVRPKYYQRDGQAPVDALILALDF